MKIINFSESNSLVNQFVAEMRDVNIQKDRMRFKKNIERIGQVMAYEISKVLDYSEKEVITPLATAKANTHDDQIVLATILRAGLPFIEGFQDMFDQAENAFISARRIYNEEKKDIDIKVEYMASPSIEGKTLIMVDPMLATGESMEAALKAVRGIGQPRKLFLACIIASKQGVEYLERMFPNDDVTLMCATIDPSLNQYKYIVPGLGDAGDLALGEKL